MKKRTGLIIATSAVLVLGLAAALVLYLRRDTLGEASPAVQAKMGLIVFKPELSPLVILPGGRGAEAFMDRAIHRAVVISKNADFVTLTIQTVEPERSADLRPVLDDLISSAQAGITDDTLLNFAELSADGPQEAHVTAFLTAVASLPADAANSLRRDKKLDAALDMASAGLIVSSRLWTHGLTWPERQAGLAGMAKSLAELKQIHTQLIHPPLVDAANQLEIQRAAAAKLWDAKSKLTFLHSPLSLHPADLLYMAKNDEDRTWRLEGVKWLGVARYSGASETDREVINRHLDELAASHDESIAQAAQRARALTLDEVNLTLP